MADDGETKKKRKDSKDSKESSGKRKLPFDLPAIPEDEDDGDKFQQDSSPKNKSKNDRDPRRGTDGSSPRSHRRSGASEGQSQGTRSSGTKDDNPLEMLYSPNQSKKEKEKAVSADMNLKTVADPDPKKETKTDSEDARRNNKEKGTKEADAERASTGSKKEKHEKEEQAPEQSPVSPINHTPKKYDDKQETSPPQKSPSSTNPSAKKPDSSNKREDRQKMKVDKGSQKNNDAPSSKKEADSRETGQNKEVVNVVPKPPPSPKAYPQVIMGVVANEVGGTSPRKVPGEEAAFKPPQLPVRRETDKSEPRRSSQQDDPQPATATGLSGRKGTGASEPRRSKDQGKDTSQVDPPSVRRGTGGSGPRGKVERDSDALEPPSTSPSVAKLKKLIPPDALKTMRLQRNAGRPENPDRPIAPKIIMLKKPPPPAEGPTQPKDEGKPVSPVESEGEGEPQFYQNKELPRDDLEDREIDRKLTDMMNVHRDYVLRKLKRKKRDKGPQYKFPEMVETLTQQGIPCPVNEDFGRLQGMHSRWDPHGTVLEYYSPMLRTFVPVNMRGRYRGCWTTDDCVKGINISNIQPKRDALEGFVDRGRHANIQQKYDEMSPHAIDEPHLDYLIELQAYHSETLPIPIFYDMLHLGVEVANEHVRILVQEEGYPPNDPIFMSAQEHADQLRRKIQMYGALGIEPLESARKGLGQYIPQWLKSRDEIMRDIMKAKDEERYAELQRTEQEADEKGDIRREETSADLGATKPFSKGKNSSGTMLDAARKMGVNKVSPAQ